MPTIHINKKLLFDLIGRQFTFIDFEELCFRYGLELESFDENLVIEVAANRPDLLCAQGIAHSLRCFLTIDKSLFVYVHKSDYKIKVDSSVNGDRPYIVGCVLKNISLNQELFDSFIELQEKLHHNICRKRKLVSIGVHDLDKVTNPFLYKGNKNIKFIPLNQKTAVNGEEFLKLCSESYLKPYVKILESYSFYPVVLDNNNNIISVPPLNNSDMSKVELTTRNLFIEITATDLVKAEIVLNTLIHSMRGYCDIHKVKVVYDDTHLLSNKSFTYPNLDPHKMKINTQNINTILGVKENMEDLKELLKKMDIILVDKDVCMIPFYRKDIMHERDIIEDIAISYGYHRIKAKTFHSASELNINKIADKLRSEVSLACFQEVLNFSLISANDAFEKMLKAADDSENDGYNYHARPVTISNAKTKEFEIIRTSLLPGMMKLLSHNKHNNLPIKLFEIGDCVYLKNKTAINVKKLCCLLSNSSSNLEIVHGVLDNILIQMNLIGEYHLDANITSKTSRQVKNLKQSQIVYKLVPIDTSKMLLLFSTFFSTETMC